MGSMPRHIRCLLLLLCFFCLTPATPRAEQPALGDITLSTTANDLMLHLKLEGAFTEKVRRAILSGIPTTFTFSIVLEQVHVLWLDEKIAQISVTHSIKYDNLKKEFIVRRSWKDNAPEPTGSIDEAQTLVNQIENMKIIPLSRMEKGAHYQLRTKAEVSKKTLPFNLHNILFFVSLWDVETDWTIIDFTF
jgi:hypothetical protein